jgi:hypothetical protein
MELGLPFTNLALTSVVDSSPWRYIVCYVLQLGVLCREQASKYAYMLIQKLKHNNSINERTCTCAYMYARVRECTCA